MIELPKKTWSELSRMEVEIARVLTNIRWTDEDERFKNNVQEQLNVMCREKFGFNIELYGSWVNGFQTKNSDID